MSITKVSTVGMSREEWLEARRHGIGGSDAGAIVGMSKYASPYTAAQHLSGKGLPAPAPGNPAGWLLQNQQQQTL